MNLDAVLKIAARVTGADAVQSLGKAIGGVEKAADGAKKAFTNVVNSSAWQAAAVGAAAVTGALALSVKEAIAFESALADVKKVVPGLESAEGLAEMKSEIIGLSRELPVSAQGLSAIVAAAGQAGIAKDELIGFTESAARMGVAFDISADEAGNAMAKMRTSMGLSQVEVEGLADAMNYLSNNMASSAPEITDFMLRVGAYGQQVAMSEEQTAALGSAMVAAGAPADVAATSFRNLIKEMSAGINVTDKQEEAWKSIGLTANEVAASMQKDAVATIRDVFQRLAKMPEEMKIPTVELLFGNDARALTPLIKNLGLLDQSMKLVGDSTQYAGSMQDEFAARAATSANQWQLLQNNVQALQIAIGDALLPALNMLMSAIMPVISVIADAATRFPVLTAAVVLLAGALAGLVLVLPAIAALISILGSLSAAGITVAGILATIAGWAGVIGPALAAVTSLFSGFGATILAIFSGPVGWTVLAVAAVVAMAYMFREPLMEFVSWVGGIWGEVLAGIGDMVAKGQQFWIDLWTAGIQGATDFMKGIGEVFKWGWEAAMAVAYQLWVAPWVELWEGTLRDPVTAAWDWITSTFEAAGKEFMTYIVDPITSAWDGLMELLPRAMETAADAVKGVWDGVMNAIKSVVNGTMNAIADTINTVIGLINNVIKGFNKLPGPDIKLIPTVSVPKFAQGGFVTRPTLAMVGDNPGGREYIVPESKAAGFANNIMAGRRGAAAIPATTGSSAAPVAAPINITTGPVMEMDGTRYVKVEDLERAVQQTQRQIYATLRTPGGRRAIGLP